MAIGLKILDYSILAAAVLITGAISLGIYAERGGGSRFVIQGPSGRWVYSSDAGGVFAVPGPLGDTMIELKEGRARVLSSPCANQSCVSSGAIHAHGQWIACLPNRVMISLDSPSREDSPDAAAW
jgi:hypothetical protein